MSKLQHGNFYTLYQRDLKQDFSLISLSDIHFSPSVTNKKLNAIYKTLKEQQPNYILIPGDLIDSTNMIEDKKEEKRLLDWVESLAKISKVIISLGNHDCYQRGNFKDGKKKEKIRYFYNKEFFSHLSKIPNVYFLDNNIYQDQNVYIAGLTLPFAYYKPKKTKRQEDESLLIATIEKNSSMLSNLPKDKVKILMIHSPVFLKEKKIETKLEEFDYFLAGHMHNGCVVPMLDEVWNTTYGVISPQKTPLPKNARNTLRKKTDKLVVNGAIVTFQACTKWMQSFNFLFPMYYTSLAFTKDKKYNQEKIIKKGKYHR